VFSGVSADANDDHFRGGLAGSSESEKQVKAGVLFQLVYDRKKT